eukprot:TRINITY_DN2988_c0_g1_i1.p1 TRINITY_DN2988_c0_g1~~TRINITY_DN2988_c0_g1_i1.p1  ORF type:complete len:761 (-),score=181.13 TRINITY_DN2988_c0_g1_i1:209-2185(-)
MADAKDPDPSIRGLAIRSLTSLQTKSTISEIPQHLVTALEDSSYYVRRTAIFGAVKLFHYAPHLFEEYGFGDRLKKLLDDSSAKVCLSALLAQFEIGNEVGFETIFGVLENSDHLSDFQTSVVIKLLGKITPTEDNLTNVLQHIESYLVSSNPSIIGAACEGLVNLTQHIPNSDIKEQVFKRITKPLLIFVEHKTFSPEIQYISVKTLLTLANSSLLVKILLAERPEAFLPSIGDLPCLIEAKLKLLIIIADEKWAWKVLSEILKFAFDRNVRLACSVVELVPDLVLTYPTMIKSTSIRLIHLLASKHPKIHGIVLTTLSRLYVIDSNAFDTEVISSIGKFLYKFVPVSVHDTDPALLHGYDLLFQAVLKITCLLSKKVNPLKIYKPFVDMFYELPAHTQIFLVRFSPHIFFASTNNTIEIFNQILKLGQQSENPDVSVEVSSIIRHLSKGVEHFHSITTGTLQSLTILGNKAESERLSHLLNSLDSLSIIYGIKAEELILKPKSLSLFSEDEMIKQHSELFQVETNEPFIEEKIQSETTNLLDLFDTVNDTDQFVSSQSNENDIPVIQPYEIDPNQFQQLWSSDLPTIEIHMQTDELPTNFNILASGGNDDLIRGFGTGVCNEQLVLAEFTLENRQNLQCVLKSMDEQVLFNLRNGF